MDAIKNRYEFVLLFDVENGNPNGDPDAGNLPRIDPETNFGLVTDVCMKRKVRNYVALKYSYDAPYDIYVKEKSILGRAHTFAYKEAGIDLGQELKHKLTDAEEEALNELTLPEGVSIGTSEDGDAELVFAMDLDKKNVKAWMKETKPDKNIKGIFDSMLKNANTRKPKEEEILAGKAKMMEHFYDVRTFGAVMSLKSAPNCGQVRGPVQLAFARSIEPISPLDVTITRMAVATEKEAEKQSGDNRTMGRKHIVPYGLYRVEGFISAKLAEQTGFSEGDLTLLWEALQNMFDQDHSAARGKMSARKLIVFKHDCALGNAPAQKLFDLVKIDRATDKTLPAREYADYTVKIDAANVPAGVTLEEKL